MPLYATLCSECGKEGSIFRRVSERENVPTCECGGKVERVIKAPMVITNVALFPAYESPTTGKWITSREARREDMKISGAIDLEPGMMPYIRKNRERLQKEGEEKLGAAIDDVVRDLNVCGKLEITDA